MSGYMCTATGRCTPSMVGDGSSVCADVYLDSRLATPNVIMLVDQSGSMNSDFGSGTRWSVLRNSLLAMPDGFIYDLQAQVRFGLALYSARAEPDDQPVMGECPIMTTVLPPALNNYDAINAIYGPADPIDETPTGESIDWVVRTVTGAPDPSADPTIIVLATDGEPDTCAQPNPQEGQAEAVAAAQRAFAAGIRLYIISVGEGTVSASHQQDMANAGIGAPAGASSPYWVAGDDAGLRDALRTIIGGEISCDVTLRGRIDASMACSGTVLLNGMSIPCDDPNGWVVVDDSHIRLQGTACETVMNGDAVTLEARFPCDVILI